MEEGEQKRRLKEKQTTMRLLKSCRGNESLFSQCNLELTLEKSHQLAYPGWCSPGLV